MLGYNPKDGLTRVLCSAIMVNRGGRQRTIINTEDIDESIRKRGVLLPIIITQDLVLVAGERRLASSIKVGHEDIPVRFLEDIPQSEIKAIELEENVRRAELPWRDYCKAVGDLHELYCNESPDWTQVQTASALDIVPGYLSKVFRVYRDLDNPKLKGASSLHQAYNILSRIDERLGADALGGIIDSWEDIAEQTSSPPEEGVKPEGGESSRGGVVPDQPLPHKTIKKTPTFTPPPEPEAPESILQGDFITWAEGYNGAKFNLVHCDFPYGVNAFKGTQADAGNKFSGETYDDDPNVYWRLLEAFCKNLDNFMAQSSHLIFWFSMNYYSETLEFFEKNAPSLEVNPFPLIWMKSDNAGILPDHKRGPRRIYETALMASRGDRPIIRATSNAIHSPTERDSHPSTKPEPVLKYFFQMFVDEQTRLLDPTCGGGSSLRAAEAAGSKFVFGIEQDSNFVVSARQNLKRARTLRKLSGGVK